MENRNILIGLGTGLVAGFMLGYGVGTYFAASNHDHPAAAAPAAPQGAPGAAQAGLMLQEQVEAFNRIKAAKAVLDKEPGNFEALVNLANDYFDTRQFQLAVDTYGKALAAAPDSSRVPDLLTDQGVMYRELKQYDKALANFQKANKMKPDHLQSLLNLGVVYANDKQDKAAARKAWTRLIELAPDSSQAQQAKAFMQNL